jgi:hypothetical protein
MNGRAWIAALALLAACQTYRPPPAPDAGVTLFHNGRIYLGDPAWSQVEALLVEDGRVRAAGTRAELERLVPAGRLVDLGGAIAVPGLQDAHAHLEGFGASLESVDLRGVASYEELVARVAAQAARQPAGSWVLGRGWDQNLWPGGGFPHHQALSERVPDHPVRLERVDGHAVLANARALELAGLAGPQSSEAVPGGRILLDERREPTGVLVDAATALVEQHEPEPDRATRERRILRAQDALLAVGLTAVHDMGVSPSTLEILEDLRAAGRLKLRVIAYLAGNAGLSQDVLARYPLEPDAGDLLSVPGVKLVADGALGSRGAALLEGYSDEPANQGLLLLPEATLRERIATCAKAGLQPAIHAIGDRANRVVLDLYEERVERGGGFRKLRPRIEHAQVVAPEDWARFAALGVVPSMQPTHCTSDMPWAPARLGAERVAGAYAWRRLAPDPAALAFGSDLPVERPHPLEGLYAALTRRGRDGEPAGGFPPMDQALDARAALAAFTSGAAWAAHQEQRRGRLVPGYACDMTVIDVDPLVDAPQKLLSARVLLTVVNGRVVHRSFR